ncbi:MAG: hypothetical protein HC933_02180 [Pleurocapsa sp. SU_196_0]|nr:hypothetical protein [Pleurocapsa sp. SU_196_0]
MDSQDLFEISDVIRRIDLQLEQAAQAPDLFTPREIELLKAARAELDSVRTSLIAFNETQGDTDRLERAMFANEQLTDVLGSFQDQLESGSLSIEDAQQQIADLNAFLENTEGVSNKTRAAFGAYIEILKAYIQKTKDGVEATRALEESLTEARIAADDARGSLAVSLATENVRDAEQALQDLDAAVEAGVRPQSELAAQIETTIAFLSILKEALEAVGLSTLAVETKIALLEQRLTGFRLKNGSLKTAVRNLKEAAMSKVTRAQIVTGFERDIELLELTGQRTLPTLERQRTALIQARDAVEFGSAAWFALAQAVRDVDAAITKAKANLAGIDPNALQPLLNVNKNPQIPLTRGSAGRDGTKFIEDERKRLETLEGGTRWGRTGVREFYCWWYSERRHRWSVEKHAG